MFDHVLRITFPKVNTPLFALRVRQLNLTRVELDGILICFAGVALGILLGFYPRFSWDYYGSYNNLVSILIFGGFIAILAGDFLYTFMGLAVVRRLRNSSQWEDLRLTNLGAQDIVGSEFAALQMRLWRFMALECAVRLALIALVVTNLIIRADFDRFNLFTSANLCLAFVYGICYGMEPLWRMRALSARALLFGTWLRDPILASLLNIPFGIFLRGIVAGAMFGGIAAAVWLSGSVMWGYTSDISMLQFGGFILLGVAIWAVIRDSHRLLTRRALKALTRRLERLEPH